MILINGRKISKDILKDIAKDIERLSFVPVFCDVLVGEDMVSQKYVKLKASKAREVGIKFHEENFSGNITTEELVLEIERINKVDNMCGLVVQLPLPDHIDTQKVLDAIDPEIDVDCLGSRSEDNFYNQSSDISFPAALACMTALDSLKLNLKDKNIVVLGQGKLVGRPVGALLRFRSLNPFLINKDTPTPEQFIKEADIIISGMGLPGYVKGPMVKKGVVVIDAGTSESNNAVVGDVDFASVEDKVSAISPVPGGVGPITVAVLLQNVLKVAKNKINGK